MFAQSVKKAKRPIVVMTLEIKLKIIADFEAGKREVSVGRELGVPPTAMRTVVADKQRYKNDVKLNIVLKFKCIHICMYKICMCLINCY
jgi:hypothetical protein